MATAFNSLDRSFSKKNETLWGILILMKYNVGPYDNTDSQIKKYDTLTALDTHKNVTMYCILVMSYTFYMHI